MGEIETEQYYEDAFKDESNVTFMRLLKIWWSLLWRATVFGGIAGFIVSFIAVLVLFFVFGIKDTGGIPTVLGTLAGIPAGLLALNSILRIEYKAFKVRIIEKEPEGLK